MTYRYAVLLAVLVGACSWLPFPPQPTPTPTPEPTPPYTEACQALLDQGLPWCDKVEPPMTCGDCVHNPTDDPRACQKAEDCPVPPPELPQPQCPTFTDRGGTLQCQSGACNCYCGEELIECAPPPVGCAHEPNLVASTCFEQKFRLQVKTATNTLGDRCGTFWKLNLEALAEQLRAQMPNRCIIAGIEAIFIQRDDGKYEENHAVASATGCWTNSGFGRYIGCHLDVADPPPPVEPPGVCSDPDPRGRNASFNLKPHGPDWDSTYLVHGRDYCDAVCSPIEPDVCFTGRNKCPVRMEGDPERPPCELLMIGEQKWWCDGVPIESNENPAQARCHGHVKTCTEDGATCSEGDWP